MNKITVDLDKFDKAYTYFNGKNDMLQLLKECEIKPAPEVNELDKLFIGAPVVQIGTENGAFVRLLSFNGNKEYKRLPTVEEAPRNVWLAPWVEMPEELNDFLNSTYLRIKGVDNIIFLDKHLGNWEYVEAIMILEDFKK